MASNLRRAAVIAALLAVFAPASAADAAPCNNNNVYELSPFFYADEPPGELAWNRPLSAGILKDYDLTNWTVVQGSINVSFSAANASQPIRNPWSASYPPPGYTASADEGVRLRDIVLTQGDGVGRLTLAWTQYSPMQAGHQCERSEVVLVTPIRGVIPKVSALIGGGYDIDTLRLPMQACGRKYVPSTAGFAAGQLRVRFTGGSGSRTVRWADQCVTRPKRSASKHPNGWELRPGKFAPTFALTGTRSRQERFRFVVTFAGERLLSGRFVARVSTRGASRIWEGSDAFINVCINKSLLIKSQGGRLYCTLPTRTTRRIRGLRLRH